MGKYTLVILANGVEIIDGQGNKVYVPYHELDHMAASLATISDKVKG